MGDLAVQVGRLDGIIIDNTKGADSGTGDIGGRGAS